MASLGRGVMNRRSGDRRINLLAEQFFISFRKFHFDAFGV